MVVEALLSMEHCHGPSAAALAAAPHAPYPDTLRLPPRRVCVSGAAHPLPTRPDAEHQSDPSPRARLRQSLGHRTELDLVTQPSAGERSGCEKDKESSAEVHTGTLRGKRHRARGTLRGRRLREAETQTHGAPSCQAVTSQKGYSVPGNHYQPLMILSKLERAVVGPGGGSSTAAAALPGEPRRDGGCGPTDPPLEPKAVP
ncbi:uncharacterized protein LOC133627311 [Colius striatus]|uniref:uncharacterized protein LOC133627311 n=1 Tax=Colius striatus TaxID=57412 RepID=UPI002B1E844B|nr:uncharacterized protein LOC133627311 [Colius striatus]